jgi:succinate dehydrogenase assembly factor 1
VSSAATVTAIISKSGNTDKGFYRREFDKHTMLDKRDFAAIEFLLRKGKRQLEIYSEPGITDIR